MPTRAIPQRPRGLRALARTWLEEGNPGRAWALWWWTATGPPRTEPWVSAGRAVAESQRPALQALGDRVRVATSGRRYGERAWELNPRWCSVSEALAQEAPVIALLGCPRLDDDALKWVGKLEGLVSVHLPDSPLIGSEGVGALGGLMGLAALHFDGQPIGAEALEELSPLSTLGLLDLRGCSQVGDEAMVHIGRLPNLIELTLNGCPVTDAGLLHLAGLTSLRRLDLPRTKRLSIEGLVRLGRALPRLRKSLCHQLYQRWAPTPHWEVLELLDSCLDRGDAEARELADRTSLALLEARGGDQAELILRPSLGLALDQGRHRAVAAASLARLVQDGGDISAQVPALLRGLADPDATVRTRCAQALRHHALTGGALPTEALSVSDTEQAREIRRLAVLAEYDGLLQAIGALQEAWQRGGLRGPLAVLEGNLSDPREPVQRRARSAILACSEQPEERTACATSMAPGMRDALSCGEPERQLQATRAVGMLAGLGADVADCVGLLGALLSEQSLARAAGGALLGLVRAGVEVDDALPALEAALQAPQPWPNDNASRALSHYRLSRDEEEVLPANCSHRRIYATSDEPLPGETRTCPCGVCGSARTVCILADAVGSGAGCHYWWEFLCLDCGRYTEDEHETG